MSNQPVTSVEAPQPQRHIMRRDEVEQKTGFKRAHIYNLMKEGKFPRAKRADLYLSAPSTGVDLGERRQA
ncbi:AlpA family phage regulatory protein [Pseudomonas sp. S5D5]|uniref:AlpA family phage regulatory protein n=1 Tax=Pseudomonas sp. S5D5 TaxID=2083056 RepID=UPI002114CD74|nr:AlpA family phage regulatory protein [Pseudomonas sp. S5D5]